MTTPPVGCQAPQARKIGECSTTGTSLHPSPARSSDDKTKCTCGQGHPLENSVVFWAPELPGASRSVSLAGRPLPITGERGMSNEAATNTTTEGQVCVSS